MGELLALRQSENYPANHKRWSVLEGNFTPSDIFPDANTLRKIYESSIEWSDQEIRQRIYYSELLLYVLEETNPELFEGDKDKLRAVGKEIGSAVDEAVRTPAQEAVDLSLNLSDTHRRKDLKKITAEAVVPGQVPIMQALKEMQEKWPFATGTLGEDLPSFGNNERVILDAAVRILYIKQNKTA